MGIFKGIASVSDALKRPPIEINIKIDDSDRKK